MKNSVELKGVAKRYDSKFKLGEINLNIPSGTIVGLIGENGAGKTTLIKAILNIIKIDTGTIKIFQKDHKREEAKIKEEVGVVLDNVFFPEILTVDNINSCMKSIYKTWDTKLFYDYLEKFSLQSNKPIKTFSKGMRKKLEIITALSHHPKLLILDEPTSGLDPVVRNEVLDLFLDFIQDEEHTVILSTHITSDLEKIADYIIFIDKGKIILEKEKDEITDNLKILKCDEASFKKIAQEDIIRYQKHKYNYEVLIDNKENIAAKYKDCLVDKITLEELMVLMIKGEK